MKYIKYTFFITPACEDYSDILASLIADAGFETFETTPQGLEAYAQVALLDADAVQAAIDYFPVPGVQIRFETSDVEDQNYNQEWEQHGFEPIIVDERICVHDVGFTPGFVPQHDIIIHPRQSFGTGTHPTTQTILDVLSRMPLQGAGVVDAGCGTGILSIMACQCGASHVLAYDIDEWSTRNTHENLQLNGFTDRVEVLLGDSAVLQGRTGYDLLVANIFREIIVADMPRFVSTLNPGGRMLLSGFYEQDIPHIQAAALPHGFRIASRTIHPEGWAILLLEGELLN